MAYPLCGILMLGFVVGTSVPDPVFHISTNGKGTVVDGTTGGTANGDSVSYAQEGCTSNFLQKKLTHIIRGTFGGGTVTVYGSNDGINWYTAPSNAWQLSAAGYVATDMKFAYWKHTIAGATTPALISYIL